MEHLLQIVTKHSHSDLDKVYYLKDRKGQVVASVNPDVILSRILSMEFGEILNIEAISLRDYQERVAINHSFDVTKEEA